MPIAVGEQQCSQVLASVRAAGVSAASAMFRSVCCRRSVDSGTVTGKLKVKSA